MKHIEKTIAIVMLLFAIGFNLWLYRLEPTATIDPNDNAFQFALVDRTNQIWDFASKKCSENIFTFPVCFSSYLVDHWVPNWAEGYNLPFYYGHVPQILIVSSYRFFDSIIRLFNYSFISLFTYYHWVIYLLLSLFPLSIFLALRVLRLPYLAAGLGAILASHISTDGLYGLDPPSFLWRGYGLSSQLFAMIWFPLAIAWSWKYFTSDKRIIRPYLLLLPVLFLTLTAMGHLGLGMIALLSLIPIAMAQPIFHFLNHQSMQRIVEVTKNELTKLLLLAGMTIFFLSYWVIPIVLGDNYHNISFWDPPWKFASYGARETIIRLLNGDLFDWGRGPWMTVLVIVGLIAAAWPGSPYIPFSFLFLFWLLLYFGRTTWGGLIDLIPGMKEFHLSRFIVGVHAAGLFLAPIGAWWILDMAARVVARFRRFPVHFMRLMSLLGLIGLIGLPIYKQTILYAQHNDRLIKQANENHAKVKTDEEALFAAIGGLPPGRVFAGRGGWWGKDFRVAETPYYMHLSTYGIPTVLWLPETWSPNSDVEQYFSENQAKDYDLFGIRYVAAPPKQEPEKFWKLIAERPTWKLYEIESSAISHQSSDVGYFTSGVRPAVVATDKRSYGNVVRLWIQSDAHVKGLYPELTFAKDYPKATGLPNFAMLDEVTYVIPDGSKHNLFKEPPMYMPPNWDKLSNNPIIQLSNETNDSDMIFKTKVEVGDNCTECIVVLKQSFHPNWKATVDDKPTETFTVFPFFLATLVPSGTHDVVFSYEPSGLKVFLLMVGLIAILGILLLHGVIRSNRRLVP